MFTRFTSMIHHAVEALAPSVPLQQEFISHWKAITQYFVEVRDHKISVDQTPIPGHLKQMLQMLVREETSGDAGVAGPCMEYLLKERILETLYTLARTDCPPGMKQLVLQLFIKLLSHIHQPLLPHIHVHRPVQRLVKMCGEVKASPAENDEIQFLLTLCSVVKQDPYLVSFFIEMPKSKTSEISKSDSPSKDMIEIRRRQNRFIIVDSLLNLLHSEDARVSVKACEGLMLVASLPEENAVRHLLYNTEFTSKLTSQLCCLYTSLPKGIYPADVESVDAKWGLDIASSVDDRHSFPGKRNVISFISWLDFCDQLIRIANRQVALTLASCIRDRFLNAILEPAIMQTSEADAIMAMAYLNRCLRLVSSPELLAEFVIFVIGDETEPEVEGVPSNHRLRQRLLERCDHISEEVCTTTWKLFETLLTKPHEHIVNNLVLRNLVSRGYTTSVSLPGSVVSSPIHEQRTLSHLSLPSSPVVPGEMHPNPKTAPLMIINADGLGIGDNSPTRATPPGAKVITPTGVDVTDGEKQLPMETAPVTETSSQLNQVGSGFFSFDEAKHDALSELPDFDAVAADFLEADDGAGAEKPWMHSSVAVTGEGDGPLPLATAAMEPSENCDIRNVSSLPAKSEQSESNECASCNTEQAKNEQSKLNDCMSYNTELVSTYEVTDIRHTVNAFLNFLPKDAISSHHSADSGYDSYLRDAKHQFSSVSLWYGKLGWPSQPVGQPTSQDRPFFEGQFLRKLLDKLSTMLHQSYEVNLQVTCVASRLALLPHPNIHEFLLNPHLPLRHGCRTLSVVLQKVANDVQARMRVIPDFQKQLLSVRHRLMGYSNNSIRQCKNKLTGFGSDDLSLLAGVIVFEEFCKELAAIAFVKHHAETLQH